MNEHVFSAATDVQVIAGVTSAASAALAWVTNDMSLAVFGVRLSIVLAGFAGSMCVLSFLPKFSSRSRMWGAVAVATVASAYLTKIALRLIGWDGDLGLGVAFGIGFTFQMVGTWFITSREKILEAVLERIRGK
jgi:hypothetical protein